MGRQVPDNAFDAMQPFDSEAAQKYLAAQQTAGASLAYLLHRVFVQNEDGAQLLEKWEEMVMNLPVVAPGLDLGQMGVREGWNCFVRDIRNSIRQVEKEEK